MGYTIIDSRTFIKTTRGIIPLALGGSNNCTEVIYDKNSKRREVRERHWFIMMGRNALELPEEEFMAKINDTFAENDTECMVYGSKWLNGAQTRKWFARAVKDAASLEAILAGNPGVNDLNVTLMPYTSGEHLLWKYVRTTDELEVWLDEAREMLKDHEDHYIFMSFSGTRRGERLRPAPKNTKAVDGPVVLKHRSYGYVSGFEKFGGSKTVHYVKEACDALLFTSAEDASEQLGDLFQRFNLEVKPATDKLMAPKPYAVMFAKGGFSGKYLEKISRSKMHITSFVSSAQKFATFEDAQAKIDALRGRYTCVQDMTPIFIEN